MTIAATQARGTTNPTTVVIKEIVSTLNEEVVRLGNPCSLTSVLSIHRNALRNNHSNAANLVYECRMTEMLT